MLINRYHYYKVVFMKKIIYLVASLFLLCACTDDQGDVMSIEQNADESSLQSSKLSLQQALSYAKMFGSGMEKNDHPESTTRSAVPFSKVVADVDFYIENGDTLLYAVNYVNDEGYVLIAGDNSSFPILAHSNMGSLAFSDIPGDSPMAMFVSAAKERVKDNVEHQTSMDTDYFDNWKDLGRCGYEYEILVNDNEPLAQTRGRENSSGKKSIYPYTGKELDAWCQEGGYNMSAPNRACIGCPALSIGMLMYDTSLRTTGNSTVTYPSFDYTDAQDLRAVTTVTETSRKLRQIADKIPGYEWGRKKDEGSGASDDAIKSGLRKLGYKNAKYVNYNFETLYKNLSFKGTNSLGQQTEYNRGVLIAASAYTGREYVGHIWFCDGYYEQSYTVTKKYRGRVVSSWTEYDDRIYMNWGWGPDGGNGWYLATDNVWSSSEGNPSVALKINPIIFVNLSNYVRP